MADLSFRQLQYLIAIAEHRHFGDAAAICNVSQPNLSSQLRELEQSLGCQLVERSPRRVFLTPSGEEVVRRARLVLAEVEEIQRVATSSIDPLQGRIRLGVIPTVTPYVLPRVLPAVRATHPALELQLTEDFTNRLVTRLVEGSLDVLLLALPVDSPGLTTRTLVEEPFLVVAPSGSALARSSRLSIEQLDVASLLLLSEGHCLREQALKVCSLPSARRSGVEGTSLTTLVQMVANGLGITLLPLLAAPVEVAENPELILRRFSGTEPGRTLGLVWRSSSPHGEGLDTLAQLFQSQLQQLLVEAREQFPRRRARSTT